MNISMMHEVIRISDRFMDRKDPDSIDRQGQLSSVLVIVFIFHAVMGIAFIQMDEYERRHPRIIHDLDMQFVFQAPPPEPTFKVGEVPKPISLTEGENPNPGSAAAPKAALENKVTLPTVNAPEAQSIPTPQAARPVVSRRTTVAPPVAITQANTVKAQPINIASSMAPPPVPAPIAGATANTQLTGGKQAGGAPGGQAGGVGTGGVGTGGTGTGEGDPGAGTGFSTPGGALATIVPPSGAQRAKGNIAPYRKDMLARIANNWPSKRKIGNMVILAEIARDGKLLRSEILSSSGNKKVDKEALATVESTEFAPLPEWFKGESIPFQIELSRVESLLP